jgi:hypothetical protein
MNRERLDKAIKGIREYTNKFSELRDEAHHFVYDLPLDKLAEKVWQTRTVAVPFFSHCDEPNSN